MVSVRPYQMVGIFVHTASVHLKNKTPHRFIAACARIGLASHLKVFPDSEIAKGRLTMQLKKLKRTQDGLRRPPAVEDLPVIEWETCAHCSSYAMFGAVFIPSFACRRPAGKDPALIAHRGLYT
jgi:hypothetical protein